MKKLIIISLVGLLSSLLGATLVCAQEKQLAGHWEGAIIQPGGELKMAVDFTAEDAIKGSFTLPVAAILNWPLRVSYAAPAVKFRLPTGLLFEGELLGDTITGQVPSPVGSHIDKFYLKRKPTMAVPYKEENVTFRSGDVALAGTLRIPLTKGRHRHPAIFLLQGSGPVARDGEWFYADYFARHGIATLVYDKPGTGSSGGDFRDESLHDEAADALAGIHYLQSRKEIDAKRVGLYGRSHGGIVASLAASLSKDVAFIVNVSGAGVSPYQQVTYQAAAQMRRDGFSESEIAEAVAYMNLKWEVARTGGIGWDKLQAATQSISGKKWVTRVQPATKLADIVPSWKLQMGYDPMPALENVRCPVLAVFGELDTLTPVAETVANYRKGLKKAGNSDVTIKIFPNADHSLLVWPKPDDRVHWPVLSTDYLDTITNWISKHA